MVKFVSSWGSAPDLGRGDSAKQRFFIIFSVSDVQFIQVTVLAEINITDVSDNRIKILDFGGSSLGSQNRTSELAEVIDLNFTYFR